MLRKTETQRKNVAICEDSFSVEFLLKEDADSEQINAWLALTPSAAVVLEKNGINYFIVDDFFDEEDLLGNLDDRLRLQVDWAMWVDQILKSKIPEFDQMNYSPAIACFYRIKNYFDRLTTHRFGLQAFLEVYQPRKIFWVNNSKSIDRHGHNIDYAYVEMILPILCKEYGIEIELYTPEVSNTIQWYKIVFSNFRADLSEKKIRIKSVAKKLSSYYWNWQSGRTTKESDNILFSQLSGDTDVLVLQDTYDMGHVLSELKAMRIKTTKLHLMSLLEKSRKMDSRFVKNALETVWGELRKESKLWSVLEEWTGGQEVAEPWLAYLMTHTFYEGWKGSIIASQYLSEKKYSAIICSAIQSLTPYESGIGVLHAGRNSDIPIFSYLHGSLPGYCHQPIQIFWDMAHSDWHFVYGKYVANYLNQLSEQFPLNFATALATGSPCAEMDQKSYDSKKINVLRRKLASGGKKPLILYIPNMITYDRRLSGDAPACMPSYDLQKKVMTIFGEHKDVQLVYKSFVGSYNDIMLDFIKSCVPNVIIAKYKEVKISNLMWAVDGIILDYPATPIREILLTNKPILTFSDSRYYKMFPEAKTLLRKRCHFSETPEEFLIAVDDFLSAGKYNAIESPNTEFYDNYIQGASEGSPSQNAAHEIIRVLDSKTS